MRWITGAAAGPSKGLSVVAGLSEREQLAAALTVLRADHVCIDAGANVGFYSLAFSRRASHVYAFEPLPRNIRFLYETMRVNGVSNVTILPLAVGERNGFVRFVEGPNHSEGYVSDEDPGDREGFPVMAVSLDRFCADNAVTPALVKIDVEGAELKVLRGALETLRRAHPHVLLSVHSGALRSECLEFLKTVGYASVRPLNGALDTATEYLA